MGLREAGVWQAGRNGQRSRHRPSRTGQGCLSPGQQVSQLSVHDTPKTNSADGLTGVE